MQCKIYNQEIQLIGIIDSIQSLIWHRHFYEPGEFELVIPFSHHVLSLLEIQNYLTKDESGEFAIIETIDVENSEDGEWIHCSGRFGPSLLYRRIIYDRLTISNTVEMVMRTLVTHSCITPNDPSRVIPKLQLETFQGHAPIVTMQVTYRSLAQTLYQLTYTHQMGWDVHLNPSTQKLIFKTWMPQDHSANQTTNPQVVFSEDYENIRSTHYQNSERFTRNIALVGGQGEGDERILVEVGEGSGSSRFETFVNARDLRWEDEMSEQEYLNVLSQRGWQSIEPPIKFIETQVILNGSIRYKEDFDLGDWVSIDQSRWNTIIHVQVSEITEVWDEQGYHLQPIFGQSLGSQRTQLQSDTSGTSQSLSPTFSPNKALVSDSGGQLSASNVSTSELSSLSGITSSIQTQLNGKQAVISGAASTVTSSNLSVNRALVSNSSGKVAVSSVTSTQLDTLSGVTSSIQTQLDSKASSSHTHTTSQITDFLNKVYPVGSIYISTSSTSPATLFGGTWTAIQNRFLVAAGSSYSAGSTGGSATHAHTSAAHKHGAGFESGGDGDLWATVSGNTGYIYFREDGTVTGSVATWPATHRVSGTYGTTSNSVGGGADVRGFTSTTTPGPTGSSSSLPPYLSVYMWQRTA